MEIITGLIDKTVSLEQAVKAAIEAPLVLKELLAGLLEKQDELRYNSFKVILQISADKPEILIPFWSQFAAMLYSQATHSQSIAIQVLANLVGVDSQNQFDQLWERYFSFLNGDKTITAAFAASQSWKIACAKPEYLDKVTDRLIRIDESHTGRQKDLIKGHAIQSFDHYYGDCDTAGKLRIMTFVRDELKCPSPRTRQAAKEFLINWE